MATILIVEDDRNLRLLTTARLEGLYTVASAGDGIEALACDGEMLILTFDISNASSGSYNIFLKVNAYDNDLNSLSFKLGNIIINVE